METKIIVAQPTLQRVLQDCLSGIARNRIRPVLEMFKVRVWHNEMTIQASDNQTTIKGNIGIGDRIDEDINFLIDAKRFTGLIQSIKDRVITLVAKEDKVRIIAGKGHFELPIDHSVSRFPEHRDVDNRVTIPFSADGFLFAINKLSNAYGRDEFRAQMTGMHVDIGAPNNYIFVGTDAHKLIKIIDPTDDQMLPEIYGGFTINQSGLNRVKNILTASKSGDLHTEVSLEENGTGHSISFVIDNYEIKSRLIDGKYPNYNAAIPKENEKKIRLNKAKLLETLRRVAFLGNEATNQVRLSFKAINNLNIEISSENADLSTRAKDIVEALDVDGIFEDMDIGFNSDYLIDIISNIDTEEIEMQLSEPNRAGIIYPIDKEEDMINKDFLSLVMPVRLFD